MKKEWKSFCYKADDALITSFKSLLQTSNVSLLKTPEQIKEMFQEMLFEDCNEIVPTSNSDKKRLCELNTLSYKWKTNNTRLIKILENYEFSGLFKIV